MRRYLIGCAAIALIAPSAYAQETTSTIQGDLTKAGGPVADATIRVLHVPSGTVATSKTSTDGSFSISGLRPGGPFTVTVDAGSAGTTSVSQISLTAGQPLRLPISLDEQSEIVVQAVRRATDRGGGPTTVVSRAQIETIASINRDVRDLARRDPFVTVDAANSRAVNIAGQNGRLNRFSVDGVPFTDSFGLNDGGLPTTRGPVPLDAVEQFSVKVAPFDITEGDFQGGSINLIHRSGTNKFSGTGFVTYASDGLSGSKTRGIRVNQDFSSKNWGGFLSGPIIKDKLFFATSYEYLKQSTPAAVGLAGSPNPVPNITQSQIDQISGIASNVYGYDTLGVGLNTNQTDEKYTAKLNWNVTDGQRLSTTYVHNKGNITFQTGQSIITSGPTLGLQSAFYNLGETVDSGIIQLDSDWASNFSTQLRGNYRKTVRTQEPLGEKTMGSFSVCLDPNNVGSPISCTPGVGRLLFGPDGSRQTNLLQYKNFGGDFTARWTLGRHALKAFVSYERFDVSNLFLANSLGSYYFDSLSALQSGVAQQLQLRTAVSGNIEDAAAHYKTGHWTLGLQDAWNISSSLSVTYGLRYDLLTSKDLPVENPFYVQRYGFTNAINLDGRGIVQPRFGFTYKATPRMTIQGSGGRYGGGTPEVFLANAFNGTGIQSNVVTFNRNPDGTCNVPAAVCNAALTNVAGGIPNSVYDYIRSNTSALNAATTNTLAPGLKPVSNWKANLSVDYDLDLGRLGDGWQLGADLLYTKVSNAFTYTDLRSVPTGTMPDGRTRYGPLNGQATNNQDVMLTNTSRGRGFIWDIRLQKRFGELTAGFSYVRQDIKDLNPMISSTVNGGYGSQASVDANGAAYGRSIYEIRNTIKFSADYDHKFFGDMHTRINLFGEWRSGRPYSLTMNDNIAGTATRNIFGVIVNNVKELWYVPVVSGGIAGDPLVTYDSLATFDAVSGFVTSKGLKQGRIVGKNTERSPSFFKVDLHVEQEVPTFVSEGRIKIFADIENVLNLINHNWGALRQLNSPYLASVVNVACAQMSGNNCMQYRYSSFANPGVANQTSLSLWGIRIGAKVQF